jgi:hypothetical protein
MTGHEATCLCEQAACPDHRREPSDCLVCGMPDADPPGICPEPWRHEGGSLVPAICTHEDVDERGFCLYCAQYIRGSILGPEVRRHISHWMDY